LCEKRSQAQKCASIASSTTATADQALTGRFWNRAIQNYWNEIAQTADLNTNFRCRRVHDCFALLNLAIADDVIAFYDAKYTYNFWRPVTAIRDADTDNNPNSKVDANWLPQVARRLRTLRTPVRTRLSARVARSY
jgi:hypothetical protein